VRVSEMLFGNEWDRVSLLLGETDLDTVTGRDRLAVRLRLTVRLCDAVGILDRVSVAVTMCTVRVRLRVAAFVLDDERVGSSERDRDLVRNGERDGVAEKLEDRVAAALPVTVAVTRLERDVDRVLMVERVVVGVPTIVALVVEAPDSVVESRVVKDVEGVTGAVTVRRSVAECEGDHVVVLVCQPADAAVRLSSSRSTGTRCRYAMDKSKTPTTSERGNHIDFTQMLFSTQRCHGFELRRGGNEKGSGAEVARAGQLSRGD
jgi:hypothetical protein